MFHFSHNPTRARIFLQEVANRKSRPKADCIHENVSPKTAREYEAIIQAEMEDVYHQVEVVDCRPWRPIVW